MRKECKDKIKEVSYRVHELFLLNSRFLELGKDLSNLKETNE